MINSSIYDGVVERIQDVYSSCSALEQKQLLQILKEISITGDSQTLEQLWLADFKAIPVSIDQFICDPYYLGSSNDCGRGVYPFWRNMFNEVFSAGNKYSEIALSGATRIGKSSSAVTIMAYMLYRLMMYRNPHAYFHKKEVSRFTIAFANLTKELAMGVAFHEYNTTLQASPWFNDHGSFNKSVGNPIYIPEGNKIDIVAASDAAHVLGMQVWACLPGDYLLNTVSGFKPLASLAGSYVAFHQYNYLSNDLIECVALVKQTRSATEFIEIELADSSTIRGTPDHMIMLSNGQYKQLCDIDEGDDILTKDEIAWHEEIESVIPDHFSFGDWRILQLRYLPSSREYPVAVCSSGKHIVLLSKLDKYGRRSKAKLASVRPIKREDDGHGFYQTCSAGSVHRLVAQAFLPEWDSSLQVNHIDGNRSNNIPSNLEMVTTQQNTKHYHESECFADTRARMSEYRKNLVVTSETRSKLRNASLGKFHTPEAKAKISLAKLGHSVSKETRSKISTTLRSKPFKYYFEDSPDKLFRTLSDAAESIGRWNGYLSECVKRGTPIFDSFGNVKHLCELSSMPEDAL